jgi:hypothetical protein
VAGGCRSFVGMLDSLHAAPHLLTLTFDLAPGDSVNLKLKATAIIFIIQCANN